MNIFQGRGIVNELFLSVYLCTTVNMSMTVIFQIAGGGHKSRQADCVLHV